MQRSIKSGALPTALSRNEARIPWRCAAVMLPLVVIGCHRRLPAGMHLCGDFCPMTIHRILKMGDPRLLRIARPVTGFDTEALHGLVRDMLDTMHDANGAGLAAPQIGVD